MNLRNKMAVIARKKLTGLGEHWGVLLPNGMVAHNTDDKNLEVIPYNQFAYGQNVKIIRFVPESEWRVTNWRIHQELLNGNKYHIIDNNCETFANRVTGQKAESPQINGIAFLSTIGLFLFMLKT